MASVTLVLKENKASDTGEMPIYIRIIKGRKTRFISLGIKVHPSLWDESKNRVKGKYPNSGRVNAYISKKLSEAEIAALELETSSKQTTSQKIKETVMGRADVSLVKYIEAFTNDLYAADKMGSYDKVNAVLSKLKNYLRGRDISFSEFDLTFLKTYERYLRDELKNAPNTIYSNLKIFRRVFNEAEREEIIDPSINPFSKYKLKTERTKKAYLTEEELDAVEKVELKEGTQQFHVRNMFVFAAYTGGIRISDLLQLRWSNFNGTHINLFTHKTKEQISIKLPSKAMEIVQFYRQKNVVNGLDGFIFPILRSDVDYSDAKRLFRAISSSTAMANKCLKKIACKAEVEKNFSFHSSRHTWATRALRKGMRIEYVSKLMGHGSLKTTMIYTKIVNSDLDSAMDVF